VLRVREGHQAADRLCEVLGNPVLGRVRVIGERGILLDDPLLDRREVGEFGCLGHRRADRIQVDVGHRGDHRSLVQQRLTLEPALPETTGHVVFGIGLASNRLVEAPHEPGQIEQPRPVLADLLVHDRLLGRRQRFGTGKKTANQRIAAEQLQPAFSNFPVAPLKRPVLVHPDHQVQVIAHHRIGADLDGKDPLQLEDPLPNPPSPMAEIAPRQPIHPAQELAPDAAADHVVIRRGFERDETATGQGHRTDRVSSGPQSAAGVGQMKSEICSKSATEIS